MRHVFEMMINENFRMRTVATLLSLFIALPLWTNASIGQEKGGASTREELQRFVAKEDDSYRWEVLDRGTAAGCRYARLHLVSQTWHDIPWKHVVWVVAPETKNGELRKLNDHAILLIAGGSWRDNWGEFPEETLKPSGEVQVIATVVKATNSVAVVVGQVPFQPMLDGRYEDGIISETFKLYLQGQGDDWPLLMPMVKSAVRTMDTAQAFLIKEWNVEVNKFTVTGASKRGWTTWLTSAVDPRVDALAPMVIDMLNMPVQMKHQVATWGKYSEEIADYTALDLPRYLDSPRGKQLQQIVDPYQYRDRLPQPKLLIFGTNDRYWPLDACNKYWNDLGGDKYLLYVPNKGHNADDYPRVLGSLTALHNSRLKKHALPKLHWKAVQEGTAKSGLEITSDKVPEEVSFWVAHSETKDFRDAIWDYSTIDKEANGSYRPMLDHPANGYAAFFCECMYRFESPAYFSTNVTIIEPSAQ